MKKLIALLLFPLGCLAQSGSPFSNNVFPAQSFTATAQTGAMIQLNGQQLSYGAGTISLTGTSLTTATIAVMGSSDNGLTYYALPISVVATPGVTATTTVTATASGLYQVSLVGITHVKFATSGTFTATSVSLVLTATPNATISRNGNGGGASFPPATQPGQLLAATAAGNTYAAQTKPALDPRDFGADFNGQTVANASTTSGSNVITCGSANCNFPSNIASASYIIYASLGTGSSCQDNSIITFGGFNETTVSGLTNANSITVVGNANTTATGTVCLAWFPKDSTAALTAWWAAGGCTGSYQMPQGKTLFSSPIMQNLAGCLGAFNAGYAYPGQTVKGAGTGSTFLMPVPDFLYTGLSGNQNLQCAVGNHNIEHYENFAVWGLGIHISGAQPNTCLFLVGDATSAFRVDLVGWNARGGGTTLDGVRVIGSTDTFLVGGSNFFGSIEMHFAAGQYILWQNNFTSGNSSLVNGLCGVQIESGVIVSAIDNGTGMCIEVNGGQLNSQNSQMAGGGDPSGVYIGNGGRANFLGGDSIFSQAGGAAVTFFAGTGSVVTLLNSSLTGSGAGNFTVVGLAGNYVYDQGANVIQGTGGATVFNGLGFWPLNNSQAGWLPIAANFALGAGFGTSPSITIPAANADMRHFTGTLTVGSGAQTQATSTVTYTFPHAFVVAPGNCVATQVGGTQGGGTAPLTFLASTPPTTTSVAFTPTTAATAGLTIILSIDCQ